MMNHPFGDHPFLEPPIHTPYSDILDSTVHIFEIVQIR